MGVWIDYVVNYIFVISSEIVHWVFNKLLFYLLLFFNELFPLLCYMERHFDESQVQKISPKI